MRVLSWDVGLRTLSYCVVQGEWHGDSLAFQVEHWDSVDVTGDTGAVALTGAQSTRKRKKVEISIEDGAQMVADAIHRRASLFENIDVVTIEQQPAGGHNRHSNVRMKVMSHVIQMYFYTRKLMHGVNQEVCFVSPASKLVDMKADLAGDAEAEGKTVNQLYARNKKYAVWKTAQVLGTLPPDSTAVKLFDGATGGKRDDLADSFLLGYYYLLKQLKPKVRAKRVKRQDTSSSS